MVRRAADGAAGARRAAAMLGIAVCAETSHATMYEEGAKVDLKLSYRHAFDNDKNITTHCQVKSGNSYRGSSSSARNLVLNIDRKTISALSGANAPGLLLWVPPSLASEVYWFSVDPRRGYFSPVTIPTHQRVTPALRYLLTRVNTYSHFTQNIPKRDVASADTRNVLLSAKEAYVNLKSQVWNHPLVGQLRVSRLAWRHVTRRSKVTVQRNEVLRVTPHLSHFLTEHPDRYVSTAPVTTYEGTRTIEVRQLLFWYNKALRIDQRSHALLLRVQETISYPTDWATIPIGLRDIRQKATLSSWWSKPEQ